MARKQAFEITVPVEDITDKFTLREFGGEGSFDGEPVMLESALPTFSPMIRFRGRQYLVNIHSIVKAICTQAPPAKKQKRATDTVIGGLVRGMRPYTSLTKMGSSYRVGPDEDGCFASVEDDPAEALRAIQKEANVD